MVISILVRLDHVNKKSCKIEGISRRTDLVIYNSQLIMCLSDIEHGTDKVLSVGTEYPCNTHDKILVQYFGHSKLAVELGCTVYI